MHCCECITYIDQSPWRTIYKNLQINAVNGQVCQLPGKIVSKQKSCCQQQDKSYRIVIASYCITNRDVAVASLSRCLRSCSLGKSDHIGIETRTVFYCASMSSEYFKKFWNVTVFAANLFSFGIQTVPKIFNDTTVQWKTESVPYQCNWNCQNRNEWENGAVKQRAHIYALRYDLSDWRLAFCITTWLSWPATLKQRRSGANETYLCITKRFVLLLTTIFQCNMICPDNCQTCP